MDGDLIHQMGLLLTQLRYARRSLEDIERSTARYTTFTFASALSAGPRWGEPPMFGGALKVWVVNINDLAPSGPGLFEGLFGGIGRFFGGLVGGLVGGTIAGVAVPVMIAQVERIAATVERIVARLAPSQKTGEAAAASAATTGAATGAGGPSFLDRLDEIKGIIESFTALFQAASGKPEQAADTANPLTPEATRWLQVLQTADTLIRGITLLVKGLTLLLPEVIGTIALLISRLDVIKLAVVELLQFILREALLLRGVALTILFDTLSAAAKLAANVLGILGLTIQDVITSVFKIFNSVFDAALAAIQFLSKGLATTIDALLQWLISTVVTTLATVADTRFFRVIVYAIESLPYILPALVMLVTGSQLEDTDRKALEPAKGLSIQPATIPGNQPVDLPKFPDVAATLLDPKAIGTLNDTVNKSLGTITDLLGTIFGDTSKGLMQMSFRLDNAASDQVFNDALDKHIGELRVRSKTLADSLDVAQKAAQAGVDKKGQETGLDLIAKAYEGWLNSPSGLNSLLGNITKFINETPTSGPEGEKSLAAEAIGPSVVDRPRATVEIDDLVIELMPPPDQHLPGGVPGVMRALSDHSPEEFLQAIVELMHEMDQRGMTFGPGALVHQA
jgi:hypothetical protein